MNASNGEVQVVIRSAGERTERLCRQLILEQGVPQERVATIHEVPFAAAMRKGFEIGIDSGCRWTYCIDADVLPAPGAIESMLSIAEEMDENVCEIQGYILDKFFGGPRPAGNHLYRTSLLPRVLEQIPDEGVNIRPEFHTLQRMQKRGFPWLDVPVVVGLHDSEQYFRDIYRKCFVHAHKFSQVTELFLDIWRKAASKDPDMALALRAFADGVQHSGRVLIDVRESYYQAGLEATGLSEKDPINLNEWDGQRVQSIVGKWENAPLFERYFELPTENFGAGARLPPLQRVQRAFRQRGIAKGPLFLLGSALQKVGFRLIRLSR